MAKSRFLKISVLIFLLAGFVFILGDPSWFPDFYAPKLFGIFSFISAFVIILPARIFHAHEQKKKESLINLQTVITIGLFLNGFGSLGLFQLYRVGFQYDKVLHFSIALIVIPFLAYFIYNWYELTFRKSILLAALIMILTGLIWEGLEYSIDFIFKTKTFGLYGTEPIRDTILDLIFNVVGACIAVSFLLYRRR